MKKIFILLCFSFCICGCGSTKLESKSITCEEVNQMLQEENTYLIDVRTEEEYKISHLKGAILLPYTEIEEKIDSYVADKDSSVIVYCKSGNRSGQAAKSLVNQGYTHVYDLGAMGTCEIQ